MDLFLAICIAHCFPNIKIIENLSNPRNLSQLRAVTFNTPELWPIFGPEPAFSIEFLSDFPCRVVEMRLAG